MIDLLLILLRPALLALEGGSKNPLHWLALVIAAPLDVVIAHTTWAATFGKPLRGEWTISNTLERLCKDTDHADYELLVEIAKKINRVSPTKAHIRSVVP